jgi:integrase
MAVRIKGSKFYVAFRWKGHRMDTSCSATNKKEAERIEKAVRNAFAIYRFDHLDPASLEVVIKIFQNKGWKLPPELDNPDPQQELTLLKTIKEYFQADERNRTQRKLYAIDRLVEYFGEGTPLEKITVSLVKKYRKHRTNAGVSNGTVNIEVSCLSGIFREQLEQGAMEMNPCSLVPRLPETQRDTYISWDDFQRMLGAADWLQPIITILYYTGMRPSEVFDLDWAEVNFSRRMIILPPSRMKEGKNANQKALRDKRVPMRREVYDLLWSLRHPDENVVRLSGRVFTHKGREITRGTKRKCWARMCKLVGLGAAQLRDLRHTFKSNAAMSGVDRTIRNAIVGHATHLPVEDLYIHIPDHKLLEAVDAMTFEHGASYAGFEDGEKSDANLTPNASRTVKKENQDAAGQA